MKNAIAAIQGKPAILRAERIIENPSLIIVQSATKKTALGYQNSIGAYMRDADLCRQMGGFD
ncbi:hypothetical protein [Pantoea rwandensis]|uniref:hypothetical protein n=1 Tax=Pantoea rwandensis TaxID=1076550 RepID=UPI001390316D|nr:hypothetical protein [Pantoea rwandensis]